MCNIFSLPEKVMPEWEKFQTCVWNNPDGYGLIIKKGTKLELVSECPKDGNDPEKLYELLDKNKKFERFLHVRWATEGSVNKDNTQPFQIIKSDDHEAWFMHNGTLHQYTSTRSYGVNVRSNPEYDDDRSDTLRFCDRILRPYARRMIGADTKAIPLDWSDHWIRTIIEDAWPSGNLNRGLLISNRLPALYLSKAAWKTIKGIGGEFLSSNDDYFDRLKRGPKFEEAEKKRKEAERVAELKRQSEIKSSMSTASNKSTPAFEKLRGDIQVPHNIELFKKRYALEVEHIKNMCMDWDLYDAENYQSLSSLSIAEWDTAVRTATPEEIVYTLAMFSDLLDGAGKELLRIKKIETAQKKRLDLLENDLNIERSINANLKKESESKSSRKTEEVGEKRAAQNRKTTRT